MIIFFIAFKILVNDIIYYSNTCRNIACFKTSHAANILGHNRVSLCAPLCTLFSDENIFESHSVARSAVPCHPIATN